MLWWHDRPRRGIASRVDCPLGLHKAASLEGHWVESDSRIFNFCSALKSSYVTLKLR